MHAAQIEMKTLNRSVEYLNHLNSEIPRNNPSLDSMMFVRHNNANWQEPSDFAFEPSPVWLDDDAMARSEAAKTFLRNLLGKSKGQLGELRREVDVKRREYEGMRRTRQNVREGKEKKDEVEVARALFNVQEALHDVERRKTSAEVEVATIIAAVGDISVGARNHNFKSQTFKIPTNCDLCGDRLWGLSAKGFDCKDCGFICHSKCEMKVPAECPGEQSKEERRKLKVERQEAAHTAQATEDVVPERTTNVPLNRSDTADSMNTLSSGFATGAQRSVSGVSHARTASAESNRAASATSRNRTLPVPPSRGSNVSGGSERQGSMLYAYQANGEGEISVSDGQEITLVEADGKSPNLGLCTSV